MNPGRRPLGGAFALLIACGVAAGGRGGARAEELGVRQVVSGDPARGAALIRQYDCGSCQ